tara:strand:+ start:333 stop:557 length:225 start_codon:yes stop_codon:yes gene_type:complete
MVKFPTTAKLTPAMQKLLRRSPLMWFPLPVGRHNSTLVALERRGLVMVRCEWQWQRTGLGQIQATLPHIPRARG